MNISPKINIIKIFPESYTYHLFNNNTFHALIFLPFILEIYPKMGSYRLQTHRHDVHRKYFPLSFSNRNFGNTYQIWHSRHLRVHDDNRKHVFSGMLLIVLQQTVL